MLKLLVISDDFTGALDTGVQFSNQGIKTLVSTEMDVEYEKISEDIEVLVLNTESRHLSFERAYEKTRKIIESAKKEKIPHIYKKVDSALRGNISAELKAILETSGQAAIPFLPAYPEMNRVLIDGNLYIDQTPVSESIFANDPYDPVTESNVILRLKREAGLEASLIKGDAISNNARGLLVFDAQNDETLTKHGRLLEKENLLAISAGCAGFAKVLAKQLFPNVYPVTYTLKKPIVVICGSVNPITKKQIEYVTKKHYPRISLSSKQLLNLGYWKSSEGKEEVKTYLDLMKNNLLIVFETFSDKTTEETISYSSKNDLTAKEYHFIIGKSLGKLTQALWSENFENTFLFTGGDTLFQSMKVLGVNGIKPVAEISPGVVLSRIEWNSKEMQVITKSGGFGTEKLFEEISQLTTNYKEERYVNRL